MVLLLVADRRAFRPTGPVAKSSEVCWPNNELLGWAGSLALLSSSDQHKMCTSKESAAIITLRPRSKNSSGGANENPHILATSASAPSPPAPPTLSTRPLLSDRKSFFAHLHPRPLLISVVRITSLTASTIFATYVTDQLEYETKNEKLVTAGELTANECDERNKKWEDQQWTVRWSTYKNKAMVGWLKYQATTLIMRLYEKIAESRVSTETLDKLTKDTFKSGLRKVERYGAKSTSDSIGAKLSGGGGDGAGKQVRSEMVVTCLWANMIAFMADATVQWSILTYGYYVYWKGRRARKRTDEEVALLDAAEYDEEEDKGEEGVEVTVQGEVVAGSEEEDDDDEVLVRESSSTDFGSSAKFGDEDLVPPSDADVSDSDKISVPDEGWAPAVVPEEENEEGAVALCYLVKTCRIIVSRCVGLVAASYGGAYGTTFWPGWGTLLGTSMADSMVASVLDD